MGATCSENESDNISPQVRRNANTEPGQPNREDEPSSDEIIASFNEAVQNGLEELVMHLDQNYPQLDLLDIKFKNGDSVLHTAIRNKNRKVLLYCLENGIKVMPLHTYSLRTCTHNVTVNAVESLHIK